MSWVVGESIKKSKAQKMNNCSSNRLSRSIVQKLDPDLWPRVNFKESKRAPG